MGNPLQMEVLMEDHQWKIFQHATFEYRRAYSTPFSIRPIRMVNPPFFQCESTIFWFRNSKAVAPEGSEEPGEARCCDVDDPQIYEILG